MSTLDTANLILITGTPGAGKTLRAVQYIKEYIDAGTPVYVCNLTGINIPGVIPWEDPTKWRDLPAGSILFVDEAQKFFRARRGGDPPEYITAMETLRHTGSRIVLITQQPSYLDGHIRGLTGRHEHLFRKHGMKRSFIFRSEECMDNVKSLRARSDSDHEKWAFPKECYPLYKSAEVHTVKFQIPSLWKKGGLFVAIAVVGIGYFGYRFYHQVFAPVLGHKTPAAVVGGPAATPATAAGVVLPTQAKVQPMSTEEYFARMVPRMVGRPWSAPMYDGRTPTADPMLLCMISGTGKDAECNCYTEQATPYYPRLTDEQCKLYAKQGVYDPFRVPMQPAASSPPMEPVHQAQAQYRTSGESPGTFASAPHYGEMHTEPPAKIDAYPATSRF